jgi:hypothetical protein
MTLERRRLARGLKTWLDVLFFLALAAAGLWLFLAPFSAVANDEGWDVSLPISIGGSSVLPVLPLEIDEASSPGISNVRVMKAQGELRFLSADARFHFLLSAVLILVGGISLWGIHLLRRILGTAAEGYPFHPMNVQRLNTLGWIIVATAAGASVLQYLLARWVLSKLEVTTVALSPPIQIHEEWIFAGLLVLVLASIWKQAVQMAEDQSLTV